MSSWQRRAGQDEGNDYPETESGQLEITIGSHHFPLAKHPAEGSRMGARVNLHACPALELMEG
jgi:hypothetical protein